MSLLVNIDVKDLGCAARSDLADRATRFVAGCIHNLPSTQPKDSK